jgi:GLPGLI family protein
MVAVLAIFFVSTVQAQNFQGIATYKSSRKMGGIKIGGLDLDPQMQKQIEEQLKKQGQKEYTLKFNLTESLWKEVESLGAGGGPQAAAGGGTVRVSFSASGSNGSLYKNTATMQEIEETEVFSKPFLVKDELQTREWELTNETKKIGNYTAQKAIFTRISERRTMSFGNDEENEMVTVSDTVNIAAWYTPEIPVSQGPDNYWGLPGLILEVNDGTTTFLCTKVVLNPENGVKIKVPSKGKKVNKKELAKITEEKREEMMKNFKNGGKGTSTFRISTGG